MPSYVIYHPDGSRLVVHSLTEVRSLIGADPSDLLRRSILVVNGFTVLRHAN